MLSFRSFRSQVIADYRSELIRIRTKSLELHKKLIEKQWKNSCKFNSVQLSGTKHEQSSVHVRVNCTVLYVNARVYQAPNQMRLE